MEIHFLYTIRPSLDFAVGKVSTKLFSELHTHEQNRNILGWQMDERCKGSLTVRSISQPASGK